MLPLCVVAIARGKAGCQNRKIAAMYGQLTLASVVTVATVSPAVAYEVGYPSVVRS